MTGTATRVNAKIKDPAKIKAITAKYVAFPRGCKDIPQEQRKAWIDELEALATAVK